MYVVFQYTLLILLSITLRVNRRDWLWEVHAVGGPVRAASAVGRPKADQIKRCAATRFEHRTKRRGGIGSTNPKLVVALWRASFPSAGAAFSAKKQRGPSGSSISMQIA